MDNGELLKLEERSDSLPSLESKLRVCGPKGKKPQPSIRKEKPVLTPLPRSKVLGRVKNFLEVFSEANRKLERDVKEHGVSCDIEDLTGDESQLIEMDLMLGVADLHTKEALEMAESAVSGSQIIPNNESHEDETDADSSDENNCEEKMGNSKKRPKIIEMC